LRDILTQKIKIFIQVAILISALYNSRYLFKNFLKKLLNAKEKREAHGL